MQQTTNYLIFEICLSFCSGQEQKEFQNAYFVGVYCHLHVGVCAGPWEGTGHLSGVGKEAVITTPTCRACSNGVSAFLPLVLTAILLSSQP